MCVLGNTRLRIIDLSSDADLPLSNEDETIWVAYNGELYNHTELRSELERAGHRFRCRADTEVLVHLYEETRRDPPRMLDRLRGMFAFALFDTSEGRLLLARDRLGIKPLYWCETVGGLAFSSEVRPLVRAGFVAPRPDLVSVRGYLAWGVVPGPRTIIEGIRELPPGSLLDWRGGQHRVERWWHPEVRPSVDLGRDAERMLSAALADSVARHLVADRSVGVFLSGGADSGAVATVAAAGAPIRTFTVTFPEADRDEGPAAADLSRRLGARHENVPATGAEVARSFPQILQAMDQPSLDGVNTWLVCKAARDAGLIVALSGLGGDELFGGYPSFRLVPWVNQLGRVLAFVPESLRKALARTAARRTPGGRVSRVLASTRGYPSAHRAVRGLFSGAELPAELDGALRTFSEHVSHAASADRDPGDWVTLLEVQTYLPNQLLRDTDQMSMSRSLEVRVPLLDDVVVRAALSLPAPIRIAPGKTLLTRAAGLEDSRRKLPFTLPFDRWMRGPLREPVRDALLSETLPFVDLIPTSLRRGVWEAFERGRAHWSRPWALGVLRLWPEANGLDW